MSEIVIAVCEKCTLETSMENNTCNNCGKVQGRQVNFPSADATPVDAPVTETPVDVPVVEEAPVEAVPVEAAPVEETPAA